MGIYLTPLRVRPHPWHGLCAAIYKAVCTILELRSYIASNISWEPCSSFVWNFSAAPAKEALDLCKIKMIEKRVCVIVVVKTSHCSQVCRWVKWRLFANSRALLLNWSERWKVKIRESCHPTTTSLSSPIVGFMAKLSLQTPYITRKFPLLRSLNFLPPSA